MKVDYNELMLWIKDGATLPIHDVTEWGKEDIKLLQEYEGEFDILATARKGEKVACLQIGKLTGSLYLERIEKKGELFRL